MKKLTSLVLAAFSAAVLGGAGVQSYTLGDADENGIIDGRDATLVLTVYAETSVGKDSRFSSSQTLSADADENGIIDGRDASWILSYYAYTSVHGGDMDLQRFVRGEPEEPVTYDYTLENITQSADVFNWNAEWLNGEILHNNLFDMYDCNGNKYCMDGNKESKVAFLLLNGNEQYNNDVLSSAFEDYSDYDIKNGALYFYRIPEIEKHIIVNIDFNDYALDKNVGTYMNNLKNAARIARETGNYDELRNILNAFYNDENYGYLWDNYAAIMFTIGYGNEMMKDEYYDPETLYTNMASEMVKNLINQSTGG